MDDHIEGLDKAHHEEQAPLPEAIAGYSDAELRRLGRKATIKLDLIIMPAMTILYILNYLDRQNIAVSNLAGITVDLGLSVTQYNTTVSILFVGYSQSSSLVKTTSSSTNIMCVQF
jgi:hypothetical protein